MNYESIKKVQEIHITANYEKPSEEELATVNKLLKEGWILLNIHERGFMDKDGKERNSTIYILGSTTIAENGHLQDIKANEEFEDSNDDYYDLYDDDGLDELRRIAEDLGEDFDQADFGL